jgi:hypothetical protein
MKTIVAICVSALLAMSMLGCVNPVLPEDPVTDPEDPGDTGKPVNPVDPNPVKDDPSINQPYTMDFTYIPDGTPEDYGFTGSTENITIDADGNIVTQTLDTASTVTFPPIGSFDRNRSGGIIMEWEIKLPYWDGMLWQNKNKLFMTLEDEGDVGVYEVLYKPNSIPEFFFPNLILKGFAEGTSVLLDEVRTWTIPPTGEGANWIKFKLVMYPDTASGGSGLVEIFYDETGSGYGAAYISVVDESASTFNQLSLTHVNAENPEYQVLVRNVSIRTVE